MAPHVGPCEAERQNDSDHSLASHSLGRVMTAVSHHPSPALQRRPSACLLHRGREEAAGTEYQVSSLLLVSKRTRESVTGGSEVQSQLSQSACAH